MKIAATAVSMDAARTYKEVEQRINGLNTTTGLMDTAESFDAFGIRLSRLLASTTQTQFSGQSEVGRAAPGDDGPAATGQDSAKEVLSQLTAQAIGQSVNIETLLGPSSQGPSLTPSAQSVNPLYRVQTAQLVNGTIYAQEETLLFSASGAVRTSDGREISFDLGLSMERTTVAAYASAFDVTTMFIDPLILQFDPTSSLLGDSTFLFDIDSNGTKESLACPGKGCGFLAFDRDGDGIINNGLELFGPASGSGFGELAELDTDANQWIDENDPIFDRLSIWSPDSQGGGSLMTLREAGVGAIMVTHAGTQFRLESAEGTVLGTIKASGIFLTEAGEVRSLQEVDLALPGTQADIGPDGFDSPTRGLEAAMSSLRNIIAMQRLRLRMMLTGERLQGAVARQEKRQDFLLNWLNRHNEWRAEVERLMQENGLETAATMATLAASEQPSEAETSG